MNALLSEMLLADRINLLQFWLHCCSYAQYKFKLLWIHADMMRLEALRGKNNHYEHQKNWPLRRVKFEIKKNRIRN